jgi:hypothetical protein
MTDAQIFQLIGIIYLAAGIGIITSSDFYGKIMEGFLESTPAYYLGGMIAIIAGFLLVTFHNIWLMEPTVIITLIGWAALIKGILIIAVPKFMIKLSKGIIGTQTIITIWAIAAIILGAVCSLLGFFHLNQHVI